MNTITKSENTSTGRARDHAMFDAELSGAVLNFHLLKRIVSWLKPYRIRLLVSGVLVLIASFTSVVMEVVISRVLVDYIIVGDANSVMPDLGMIEFTRSVETLFALSPLYAAGAVFFVLMRSYTKKCIFNRFDWDDCKSCPRCIGSGSD